MSDLIRRENAIDALKKIMFTHLFECGEYIGEDTREVSIMNAEKALDVIETLPSAEPERKWIPVSEALPEICQKDVRGNVTFSKQVWSCQKYGDGFFWQSIDQYTTNNGGGWLSEVPHDDPNDCCKVVAWMPLPEPWGGER